MAETKRIHRLAPCPGYDVERIESWLQDMAGDGWHLEDSGELLGLLTFNKGESQNVRYRLEPKPKGQSDSEKPNQDIREICKEYGWEFVCAYDWFYIYRTPDPKAREMNTDLEVQAVALKSVIRQTVSLLVCHLVFLWGDSLSRMASQPFRSLITFGPLYFFGFWAIILWAILATAKRLVHMVSLRRILHQKIPLDHNKPWRKGAAFHRWLKITVTAAYLLVLSVMITQCTSFVAGGQKMETYTDDPPFVTMIDLCKTSTDAVYTVLNPNLANAVDQRSTLFAPVYMEWREEAEIVTSEGETLSGELTITYVETISPWLARGMAEDLLEYDAKRHPHYQDLGDPELEADFTAMYTILSAGNPRLIIQHGNTVIQAEIYITDGSEENLWRDWAELQLSRMKSQ